MALAVVLVTVVAMAMAMGLVKPLAMEIGGGVGDDGGYGTGGGDAFGSGSNFCRLQLCLAEAIDLIFSKISSFKIFTLDLLKNVQVEAIIGPATSTQADFVINLGGKAQVPIISFSATSPSLSSIRSPYFIRATHNDSSQVKAISAIIQAYGWREVVPIYVDNELGEGIFPFLSDALQEIDTRIPYRSIISPSATDDQIATELYKLMTMQTRVFIVHMLPSLSSKLFTKAKEVGMMSEGYVWIITYGITDLLSSLDASIIDSMQGVLGVKPHVPRTKEHEHFRVRWKRKFQQHNPTELNAELNIFGLW
ncbi:hypothetical protein F0562_007533 [Nyssa sinensis]|uniref:Receptor ligand binding region domain-containing protein n=1 Tax=Nyssa sinensis TaxID=561372 RepID=A0A5J5A6N9_9ASTE|nr:hypothetical protein F0562_007533 [Nyssa sinensis]